jgi:ethanolamine ammonia-lyase small subunit
MNEKELAELIRKMVVTQITTDAATTPPPTPETRPVPETRPAPVERTPLAAPPEDIKLAKKVAHWLGADIQPSPWFGNWRATGDRNFYLSKTPARLAVGRAGPRYRTDTILDFLTDHAAAKDAVQSMMNDDLLTEMGIIRIKSGAGDKKEFLARPDLGRRLADGAAEIIASRAVKSPQVQIVLGDGLSATAINANLRQILPALEAQLRGSGVRIGTTIAIDNSRVAAGDHVARQLDADVLCMLVGERPGLMTAESMGAYVTYLKVENFNEAMRSVISNIHRGGLDPATEGARQVAELCLRALRDKRTGVEMS